MAGKKVCSTEWKPETLKYPLSSTVATHSHFFYFSLINYTCERKYIMQNNKRSMEKQIIEIIAQHVGGTYEAKQKCAEEILRLFSVEGRSEPLKCQCKRAQFTRTVDADFNPLCGRCGKTV
jgi:hypothetical protein